MTTRQRAEAGRGGLERAARGRHARTAGLAGSTLSFLLLLVVGAWACTAQPVIGTPGSGPNGGHGLNPSSGPPGTEVVVEGRDFREGPVQIRWGSVDGLRLGTPNGPDFRTTIVIPEAKPSVHYVVAFQRDAAGNVENMARAPFEVTETAGSDGQRSGSGDGQTSTSTSGDDGYQQSSASETQTSATLSGGDGTGDSAGDGSTSEGQTPQDSGEQATSPSGSDAGTADSAAGDSSTGAEGATTPDSATTDTTDAGEQPAADQPAAGQQPAPAGDAASAEAPSEPAPAGAANQAAPQQSGTAAGDDAPTQDTPAGETRDRDALATESGTAPSADLAADNRAAEAASAGPGEGDRQDAPASAAPAEGEGQLSARSAAGDLWSGFQAGEPSSLAPGLPGQGTGTVTAEGPAEPLSRGLALLAAGLLAMAAASVLTVGRRRRAEVRARRRGGIFRTAG